MLAWLRTALALIATGVALELLGSGMHDGLRTAATTVMAGAGICMPVLAWLDWARVEGAMRHDSPLPSPILTVFAGLTATTAGALTLLGLYL
jgi:putative membrane protein